MDNNTSSSKLSTRRLAIIGLIIILFFPMETFSQCAMCRAVLESSGENSMAEGINDGIVYLMAIPYILVAFLFYFVYRKLKSKPA
ncbi:MAG: hypothetical protein WBM43_04825 [Flavobacteriaceae bacterium]